MYFSKSLNLVGFRYHSQDFLTNGIKADIFLIGGHYHPQPSSVKSSKTINNIDIAAQPHENPVTLLIALGELGARSEKFLVSSYLSDVQP